MQLMKLRKIHVISAILLIAGSSATVMALQPENRTEPEPKKIDKVQQVVVEPEKQAEVPETTQTLVEQPQEIPEPEQPKTPKELKAIGRQLVLSDGQDEEQANCFEEAIDRRYGWPKVTEDFVIGKFKELDSIYVGMCPAYGKYKTSGNTAPGFRD